MASFTSNPIAIGASVVGLLFVLYLWILNRAMRHVPADASKLAQKRWSTEEIRAEYQRILKSPTDVRPYLFSKTGRRYVITGGSGLVGGWIVQHLLLRGEDPAAIRILDMATPTRPEVAEKNVKYIPTDISDMDAVVGAFKAPWPAKVAKKPLTVFHTAAYINPGDRHAYAMPIYERINIQGTENVLNAARAAGATCFISTSSGSISVIPINYWIPPWKTAPDRYFQLSINGDSHHPDGKMKDFGSAYSYSKNQAEQIVRKADDPQGGLRTGAIRPCHGIYGHGVNNRSSSTYDCLRRGGLPTWLSHYVTNFANAQNVSIGHLAYEHTLLAPSADASIGGRGFAVTDPGGPIHYSELYKVLSTLAHPMHPARFPDFPPVILLLATHCIEAYDRFRRIFLPFLPGLTGDMAFLQPAMLQMCTMHNVFDDSAAKKELGYDPPITPLDGLCEQVVYFNRQVDAKLAKKVAEGKGGETKPDVPSIVPKAQGVPKSPRK